MAETTQRFSPAKIREARHSAGMTQAALAMAISTRERNIIRWENNQHAPRFHHVAAIAEATGKDISFFLESTSEDESAEEEDALTRIRRVRAELVLSGRDDLAEELLALVGVAGMTRSDWPDARLARKVYRKAIRDGVLVPQPCEICGNEKSEGHHYDYDKPLEVRWLCRYHHAGTHARFNGDADAYKRLWDKAKA